MRELPPIVAPQKRRPTPMMLACVHDHALLQGNGTELFNQIKIHAIRCDCNVFEGIVDTAEIEVVTRTMGNINDIYGKPLAPLLNVQKCNESKLWDKELLIVNVEAVTIQEDKKLRMTFDGMEDTLAVNKTNAQAIAEVYGVDFETWKGKTIILHKTKRPYQGKIVDAIETVPKREA